MTKNIVMLAAVILMCQATSVFAEDKPEKPRHEKHMSHDSDGDGMISESEFLAKAKERFAKMDANDDGKISREEAQKARQNKREKMKEFREKRQENKLERDGRE